MNQDAPADDPAPVDPTPTAQGHVPDAIGPQQAVHEAQPSGELDRILDIALTVHVELGRRKMRISELLEQGSGSVLELETAAGSSLAIYANDTLVAEGEAVVVGDRYGIRITDIVPAAERVRRLGAGGDR